MKWGFSEAGRYNPSYRPMEQTSTKSINQSETLQLPSEQRDSDPCLKVREDGCDYSRGERLARGVIHDVNNHLSVVINYAHVLARYLRQDNRLSSYVQEMRNAAWRASELSQQLSASRERNSDEPRVQDINFAMYELAPLLQSIIGQSVRLELILAADLWSVAIPVVQIEQLLINLAVSGRDRMSGHGTLVIASSNCEIKDNYPNQPSGIVLGRYVRVSVSNSGDQTGIQQSRRAVRDPGSRSDSRQLSNCGHTVIADTVKECNGYFFHMSDDSGGSTYAVYLPVNKEKVEELRTTSTYLP